MYFTLFSVPSQNVTSSHSTFSEAPWRIQGTLLKYHSEVTVTVKNTTNNIVYDKNTKGEKKKKAEGLPLHKLRYRPTE